MRFLVHCLAASICVTLAAAHIALADDPEDLLRQAVEENNPVGQAAPADVDRLVNEADQLAEQQRFNEAISLYERAYRLAPNNRSNYVRLLVAKRAAGRLTDQDRQALALIEEQQAVEINQAFRSVQLNMIEARSALRGGDLDLARTKIDQAESILADLPDRVDTTPYRRQLMTLRNGLQRRTANAAPTEARPAETHPAETQPAPDPTNDRIWAGDLVDVDALLDDTADRLVYARELDQAMRQRRARRIINNQHAALPPEGLLEFPHDWAERTARRQANADGVVYRGLPFQGDDGETYYTAVYDLGDLVHPVPNFYATFPGFAWEQRRALLDRQALRRRSQIFNGYPEDLAYGLPLLHYFGGVDHNAVSAPFDIHERDRIVETVERFLRSR